MLPALPADIDPEDVFSAVQHYRTLGLLHPADEGTRRARGMPPDDYQITTDNEEES